LGKKPENKKKGGKGGGGGGRSGSGKKNVRSGVLLPSFQQGRILGKKGKRLLRREFFMLIKVNHVWKKHRN